MGLHAWLVLLPALVLLSSIPGPNNLLTATHGLRFGAGRDEPYSCAAREMSMTISDIFPPLAACAAIGGQAVQLAGRRASCRFPL